MVNPVPAPVYETSLMNLDNNETFSEAVSVIVCLALTLTLVARSGRLLP
jgi:hypothetical protein